MCYDELVKTPLFDEIKKLTDDANSQYEIVATCYKFLKNGKGRILNGFSSWYRTKYNESISGKDLLKVQGKDAERLAKRMKEYTETFRPSVQNTVRRTIDATDTVYSQYPSILDREVGKTHSAVKILKIYNLCKELGQEIKGNVISYYTKALQNSWDDELCACIALAQKGKNNKSVDAIKAEFKEKQNAFEHPAEGAAPFDLVAWIDKQLGGNEKTIQAQNVFAVWKELNGDTRIRMRYMDEVLCDPILASLRNAGKSDYEKFLEVLAAYGSEDNTAIADIGEITEEEYDRMISLANSHDGLHSNFMVHLSERLFNYFNSLPKTTSSTTNKGQENLDTNNRWGIAECFSAEEISSLLYSLNQNYMNIETMINTIEDASKTIPGMEGLSAFVEKLRTDYDFATEVATCFIKTVIPKMQINVSGSIAKASSSNTRSNDRATMFFNAKTDLLNILSDVDSSLMSNTIKQIDDDLFFVTTKSLDKLNEWYDTATTEKEKAEFANEIELYKERFDRAKTNIVKAIRTYFPSIQEKAIIAYLYQNDDARNDIKKQAENIKVLSKILAQINKKVDGFKAKFEDIEARRKEAVSFNARLKTAKSNKEEWANDYSFKDVASITQEDPIYDVNYLNSLCDALLPYSVIKLQLNSPNAKGNNASDVINNNYITRLKKIMEYTVSEPVYNDKGKQVDTRLVNPALVEWGKQRLRSKQFKYSAIFLEHYDGNGQRIPGIFRETIDGEIELTKEGPQLLEMYLFDGATFEDQGTNAVYAEMGQGGYLPCAYAAFHKAENKGTGLKFANYLCRTPSDAPKNFVIRAPRHDCSDLIIDQDPKSTDRNIEAMLNGIPTLDADEVNRLASANKLNTLMFYGKEGQKITQKYLEDRFELLTDNIAQSRYKNDIPVDSKDIIENEDGTASVYVYVEGKEGKYVFKFTGEVIKSKTNYGVFLRTKSFDGVLHTKVTPNKFGPDFVTRDNTLSPELRKKIDGKLRKELQYRDVTMNGVTYTKSNYGVNKKSRVFTILKNIAKQDLLNIACAMDHYFDTKDDGIVIDSNTKKDGEKIIKIKKGVAKKGYAWYHTDGKGNILVEENGRYSLPGKGFHSNSFVISKTVVDENGNERVVTRNYIDELITTDLIPASEEELNKKKPFQLFYGGDTGNYLHVVKKETRDKDGNVIKKVEDIGTLTEAQEEALDAAISDFITDYIEQAKTEIRGKKDFIHGVSTNTAEITDFALNNFIWFHVADDIFDGSSSFYKDSQTQFKRAKQIQGSGIPYGIVDYLKVETDTDPQELRDKDGNPIGMMNAGSFTENGVTQSVQSIFANTILDGCLQRDKFWGVTVANTKMTNYAALERLKKELMQEIRDDKGNILKKGLSEERAMELLYGPIVIGKDGKPETDKDGNPKRRGGFTEQKVNDAQSYITFDEWVRRVAARGQLKKYMPLIKRLLDEDAILTNEDIKEFIQVQKNFYYDMWYDPAYEMYVPRQIKNAEFVLVPRLIKGTELEKVYDMMKEAGIDQLNTVETSKAANEEVITLWDNKGDFHPENFVSDAQRMKQPYDYTFLYTQQETPQHVASKNKAGIQIVKKIIDNIPPNHPLYSKKQEYFRVFCKNIRESYNNVMRSFNVPTDEDGNILLNERGDIQDKNGKSLNKKVFYKRFREELLRTGMDKNLIDYVTLNEDGEPKMPAYFNVNIKKLEQVAQSLFNNKITRQTLPGYHAAQVTNIGWKALNESVDNAAYCKELEYHPMQYRNKNDGTIIANRKYQALTDEEKQNYEEAGCANYIEIMLPAKNFGIDRNSKHYRGMTDQEIIDELERKGLDMTIGYRIPTEGKQSMCIMKVVGFTDDIYGSTIIVPNDWVSQTGSDFDIDTVYGIHHETYKTHDGEINSVPYTHFDKATDDNKEALMSAYWAYVNDFMTSSELDEDETKEVKEAYEKVSNIFNTVFEKLNNIEKLLYKKAIHPEIQDLIFNKNEEIIPQLDKDLNEGIITQKERRIKILESWLKDLVDIINKLEDNGFIDEEYNEPYTESEKKATYDFFNIVRELYNVTVNPDIIREKRDPTVQAIYDEAFSELEEKAKKIGAKSFDDFVDMAVNTPEEINSRRARNNRILDLMIEILGDPTSLEENLSRSNFDDIIYWRNKIMNENVKTLRENRNPYNIFDQIKNQEDATSGLALKGMSVAMDTFCSVCNTVRPELTRPVLIVYDNNDFTGDNTPDKVLKRFGQTTKAGKTNFAIRHNTYGFSNFDGNGDRNVAGKLITAYSSQTTAHILDAVKEGNIPGVTQFTFPVYKTIVNIGSDYKTAISFIMQPAIQQLVSNHEKYNSVFATSYGNPVHQTVRELIAKITGEKIDRTTNIHTLISNFNGKLIPNTDITYAQAFNKIFAQVTGTNVIPSLNPNNLENLPIVVSMLYDRIKKQGMFSSNEAERTTSPLGENIPYEVFEGLFDLSVILNFAKLNSIANNVGKIQRVCNPDKFGAKQTVFATNEVFRDINEILYTNPDADLAEEGLEVDKKERRPILTVEGKHFLEAVYPGISEYQSYDPTYGMRKHKLSESKYPTLYAYIRYASASSIIINKQLFDTMHENFMNAVRGITTIMSGANPRIDEELYGKVQSYMLAKAYNDTEFIKFPITVTKDENGDIKVISEKPTPEDALTQEQVAENEKNRILGFNYPTGIKYPTQIGTKPDGTPEYKLTQFTVKNLSEPTPEECEAFAKLTPAQKVQYIQHNFTDSGIFGLLTATLHNPASRRRYSDRQTIEFQEDGMNYNTVYRLFYDAFNNDHPFCQMAAIDIIKYAIVAENMSMTKRGVTRTIDNRALMNEFGLYGVGFVRSLQNSIGGIRNSDCQLRDDEYLATMYERFFRSHSDMKGIRTLYLNKDKTEKLGFYPIGAKAGIVHLTRKRLTQETEEDTNNLMADWLDNMKDAGILWYDPIKKEYIPNTYLRVKEDGKYTLYKIRYAGEIGEVFLCPLNKLEYNETSEWSAKDSNNQYRSMGYYDAVIDEYLKDVTKNTIGNIISDFEVHRNVTEYNAPTSDIKSAYKETAIFDINTVAEKNQGMNQALIAIQQHFDGLNAKPLYITNNALTNYIFTAMPGYASTQTVTLADGSTVKVKISKISVEHYNNEYFKMFRPEGSNKWILALPDKKFNERIDEEISDDGLKEVFRTAKKQGRKLTDNLFKVEVVNDVMMSAEENIALSSEIQAIDYLEVKQKEGEKPAIDTRESLRMRGVNGTVESIKKHRVEVNRHLAKYATTTANELYAKFYAFCPNPNLPDSNISILSDEVQAILGSKYPEYEKDRHVVLREYMKLINDIKGFIQVYGVFDSKYIDDDDVETKHYITQIQNALAKIKKLPVDEAIHKLNSNYITSLSTNPLIRERTISIMDNFWANTGYMWKFNDIMESGNPLLQVILKDVMADVDAKDKATQRRRRELKAKIKDIRGRAKAAGQTIDESKFIDEDGRIRGNFTAEFARKHEELREAKNQAAREFGYGSIEHLKAKLEYDEFEAKHINKPASQEYYLKKCEIERALIEQEPVIYSAYMKLYFEMLDIMNSATTEGITEEDQVRLDEVKKAMHNLYANRFDTENGFEQTYVDENGVVQARPRGESRSYIRYYNERLDEYIRQHQNDPLSGEEITPLYEDPDPDVQNAIDLYGLTAAIHLGDALAELQNLNNEYFKYDSKYGFEDLLKINLDIIHNAQDRDANGIPRRSEAELSNNRAYQDAKLWIARNARFVINETTSALSDPNSFVYKLKKAFSVLKAKKNGKIRKANEIIKEKKAYDAYGTVDGSLLSDEDRAKIKEEMEDVYILHELQGINTGLAKDSDRALISNAEHGTDIYRDSFYENLRGNGTLNENYYKYVTGMNKILEKYYDPLDGFVHLERAKDDPQGIEDLRTLATAYQHLRYVFPKRGNSTNGKDIAQFIEEFCEEDTNTEAFETIQQAFDNDNARGSGHSDDFIKAFIKCQYELDLEGNIVVDDEGKRVPNRFLYTTIRPSEPDKWIDKERTEAINTFNTAYRKTATVYWHKALNDARNKARLDPTFNFQQWYADQHVYNPYTRKLELLDCWTTTELREELFANNQYEAKWVPLSNQREKVPNDGLVYRPNGSVIHVPSKDHRNHNYKPDGTKFDNYIVGSGYDNNIQLNEFEKELRDLYKDTLEQVTNTSTAARFFEKGYMPRRRRLEEKSLLKRVPKGIAQAIGFSIGDAAMGEEAVNAATSIAKSKKGKNTAWHKDIDYIKDKAPLPPMTQLLKDEELGSLEYNEPRPERKENETNEEFNERLETWRNKKKEVDDKNREINNKLLDRNWDDVLDEFLGRMGRYNAVEDNKQKLYYLLSQLKEQKAYSKQHGLYGELAKDGRRSTKENPVYDMNVDEDLIASYTTFMRRLLYDQWKRDEGILTNLGRHLQGYTSANYMMLNYKAGIANVLVGEVGIIAEKLAGEYMSGADWTAGSQAWIRDSIGMIRNAYTEIACNKADATAKYFRVVDYDELNGVSRELDMDKYAKRVRDFMFHPQSITENFMQNSVLFGMLHAHRIIQLDDDPTGIGYTFMNEAEYVRYRESKDLMNLLTDEQKREFEEEKAKIVKDPDLVKDYAWWRRDLLTQFLVHHMDKNQRLAFAKKRKENSDRYKKEFRKKTSMWEQIDLGKDGFMSFKENTDLAGLHSRMFDKDTTCAERLCGMFSERVRKVNNKIHGVYNRMGQAYIESTWWGGLVMQYHKHLPMGLLKHYRSRGYYNETRGTREKGMWQSLADFLMLNAEAVGKDNHWTQGQISTVESLQILLKHTFSYLAQISNTWAIIQPEEKGNIKRNLADLGGVVAGIAVVVALMALRGDGDDDDEDSILANLALYEADRMAAEVFLYNPLGLWTETKTLMSTPVAAQSVISDLLNGCINIGTWITKGGDYDMTYKSGRFAGENKLWVYFQRRLPVWNGIRGILELPENNRYYKVGRKPTSVASTINHWLSDED